VVLQRSLEQSDADVAKVEAEKKAVVDGTAKVHTLHSAPYTLRVWGSKPYGFGVGVLGFGICGLGLRAWWLECIV